LRRTGPTNIVIRKLVEELRRVARENGARAWFRVAEELEKPRRARRVVNLSRINRYARENETVVVPGVVLGSGFIDKKVTVVALRASRTALRRLREAGCTFMTLKEALKVNPKASNVRIIG
jgi:large subunit ribosomal protein L18e